MSLPSASETEESQTILEKQNKNIISRLKSADQNNNCCSKEQEKPDQKLEEDLDESEDEESSEEINTSDNDVVEVKKSEEENLFKFRKLSEESLDDEADREIKEILKGESEEFNFVEKPQEALEKTEYLEEKSDDLDEKCDDDQSDKQSTIISGSPPKDPFLEEHITDDISHPHKETIIDEDLLPQGALDQYNKDHKDKPPVPLQTYLWEEVKRSKEQVSDNVCKPNAM